LQGVFAIDPCDVIELPAKPAEKDLGRVRVGVDESRQDELAATVDGLAGVPLAGRDVDDDPVFCDDRRIFDDAMCLVPRDDGPTDQTQATPDVPPLVPEAALWCASTAFRRRSTAGPAAP
jgi:hypothetical protein